MTDGAKEMTACIPERPAEQVSVKIHLLAPDLGIALPRYMSESASGMDLAAAVEDDLALPPGRIALVPTGVAVALPPGFEFQIRPRSGLAVKHGITVVNAPGTIDADYRGEIRVGLINLGGETVSIRRGQRIAQMVLCRVWHVRWQEVETLPPSRRGAGGFGHSGIY